MMLTHNNFEWRVRGTLMHIKPWLHIKKEQLSSWNKWLTLSNSEFLHNGNHEFSDALMCKAKRLEESVHCETSTEALAAFYRITSTEIEYGIGTNVTSRKNDEDFSWQMSCIMGGRTVTFRKNFDAPIPLQSGLVHPISITLNHVTIEVDEESMDDIHTQLSLSGFESKIEGNLGDSGIDIDSSFTNTSFVKHKNSSFSTKGCYQLYFEVFMQDANEIVSERTLKEHAAEMALQEDDVHASVLLECFCRDQGYAVPEYERLVLENWDSLYDDEKLYLYRVSVNGLKFSCKSPCRNEDRAIEKAAHATLHKLGILSICKCFIGQGSIDKSAIDYFNDQCVSSTFDINKNLSAWMFWSFIGMLYPKTLKVK